MHSQEDLKCLCVIRAGIKPAGVLLSPGAHTHNKWAPRGNNTEKTHRRSGSLWVKPGDGEAERAINTPRGPRPQGWPPTPCAARPTSHGLSTPRGSWLPGHVEREAREAVTS